MKAPVMRPVDAVRQELRRQTAVLAWFRDDWLVRPDGLDDAEFDDASFDFVVEDCHQTTDHENEFAWMLSDRVRRAVLQELGREGALRYVDAAKNRPTGEIQEAFEQLLRGDSVAPASTSAGVAAQLQATRWFTAIEDQTDARGRLKRRKEALEILDPFRAMVANGFFGREAWLARLGGHLGVGDPPLVISGVGGVGKSTLLAKFTIDAMRRDDELSVVYLNFDRGALDPSRPSIIGAEILRQVALQRDEHREALTDLAARMMEQEDIDRQAGGSSSRETSVTAGTPLSEALLDHAAAELESACPGPLLLLLDTFEEVQRHDDSVTFGLWELLKYLTARMERLRLVIAGRAVDNLTNVDWELTVEPLHELDDAAAVAMLVALSAEKDEQGRSKNKLTETQAVDVLGLVSRNPLSVRLAAEVIRRTDEDDPLLGLELQEGQIQGQLYDRILSHIDDEDVRRLAHPGLVVRAVTPELIRDVLAKPCGVDVDEPGAEHLLFQRLGAEATLVEVKGTTLVHRPDVRALMLPSLARDQATRVAQIHRRAVKYYKQHDGVAARAEELYHRLMLDQTERTLNERWMDEALALLRPSLEELPPRARVYVGSRSDGKVRVPPEAAELASEQAWARTAERRAQAELSTGRPDEALAILHERRGNDGTSLLPSVEIEALEDLREFDRAIEIAHESRAVATRRGDLQLAVALSQDIVRLHERNGDFETAIDAVTALRDSLRGRRGESALDFLTASVTLLRLLRRVGRGDSVEHQAGVVEATGLAERMSYRELSQRPGLIRELLAEIGGRSQQLLEFGVETVGVLRGKTDHLDEALDRVEKRLESDEEIFQEIEPEGLDLGSIANRGRLGKRLSGYTRQAGPDDDLAEAISESYQVETDDLYS